MFNKALIPVIALAATAVAVPSAASASATAPQHRGHGYVSDHRGWQPISVRKHQLDRRIDVGIRSGQLSRREAARLKSELNQLVRLEYSYRRNGLSLRERETLDRRYDRLAAQIHYERRDRNGRRW
jgi:hypothetical protein